MNQSKYFTRITKEDFKESTNFKLSKECLLTYTEIQDLKKYLKEIRQDETDIGLTWIELDESRIPFLDQKKDAWEWSSFPFDRYTYYIQTGTFGKDANLTWRYSESGIGGLTTHIIRFTSFTSLGGSITRKSIFTLSAVRGEDDWTWVKSSCRKERNSPLSILFANEEAVDHYYKCDGWLGYKKLVSFINLEYPEIIKNQKEWIGWH